MASTARSRIRARQTRRLKEPIEKSLLRKQEDDFLASVMVSVSASLEKMSEEEREQAVRAAEQAVAHLR